jgi:hypothetical protein
VWGMAPTRLLANREGLIACPWRWLKAPQARCLRYLSFFEGGQSILGAWQRHGTAMQLCGARARWGIRENLARPELLES